MNRKQQTNRILAHEHDIYLHSVFSYFFVVECVGL